jgi:hypothetical protein
MCELQVPWLLISTVIFTLDYHTILNETSYFKFVNNSAGQQINLKKENWIACVVVCQPVVAERGPFRDLPRILYSVIKTFKLTQQNGKLHA